MNDRGQVKINMLPSGVPRLDLVLGGGVPEFSFNLIAGDPGSGKTTLTHQIMFATATKERPAIYFTILGEPALKMLRYQQQFSFFDRSKVDRSIHFINLSREAMVLLTLREDGDAPLQDLAKRTKLKRAELMSALNRLVALKYAGKKKKGGELIYRATEIKDGNGDNA